MTNSPLTRDFSRSTIRKLAARGIVIIDIGLADVYGTARTYTVNDNGCAKVWSFNEVKDAAK